MKTVLLDCDGVMADFVGSYLAAVRNVTGKSFTHEQVTEWDMDKALGLTPEEARAAKATITYDFCASIKPIEGAIEGASALMKVADVYVVTSPWNSCVGWTHAREGWLKKHLGIKPDRILHGAAKHLVEGDFLVDDKTSTVVKWQEYRPARRTGVLWDGPWNAKDEWYGHRTNSWYKMHSLVDS